MLLRDAVPADLPAMMDVQESGAVLALGHIFPQDAHPFPRAALQARWAVELADPDIDVSVIEDGTGQVAGFVAIRGDELLHFGTAVETWGTGLAAAAHEMIVERFAAAGLPSARLRVFVENHRARRFYEKMGWRSTGRISRTSFPPNPELVEYRFVLED